MGPQGAGKGTQAHMLANRLRVPIIATGDMLREIALSDTPIGRQVREVQAAGGLVSDDILAEVVQSRLCRDDCVNGCILDGFPRTLPQAQLLEDIGHSLGPEIIVLNIDVPRDELYRRLTGRLTCTKCGSIYHVQFQPPRRSGICDLDGATLFTRSDDNEEAIAQRLALYDEKTRPLLEYYRKSGRLHSVDGTGTPEEVFSRVAAIIGESAASNGGKQ